jgi:hypothetical protein
LEKENENKKRKSNRGEEVAVWAAVLATFSSTRDGRKLDRREINLFAFVSYPCEIEAEDEGEEENVI